MVDGTTKRYNALSVKGDLKGSSDMRKLTATVIALLFLATLSVPAFAAGSGKDSDRVFAARKNANACATEDTVYFLCNESVEGGMEHYVIRYLDKATGITGPLCGRPECLHTDADCNAYVKGRAFGIAYYDGRLYWVAAGEMNKYYVYSAAPDGTDHRTVRELDGELVPDEIGDWSFQFHREHVYLSCIKNTVINGEVHESGYIAAWPLDPDEAGFVVLDEEGTTLQMSTQLYGDDMYIVDVYRTETGEKSPPRFRRWDITTGQMEVLFDGQPPFAGGISDCWVTEDSIYTVESHPVGEEQYERSVYRYDLADGTFERSFEWFTGGPCAVGISDDLCVAVDSETDGRLAVIAADFQGNTVLDAELAAEGMPRGLKFLVLTMAGEDGENMYFYNYNTSPFFVSVALDGSGARILWP